MMRLALSSAAAPDATLDELLAACARRGMAGLELRDGDAHGVGAGGATASGEQVAERAAAAGVTITGLRVMARDQLDPGFARLSESIAAPLIIDGGERPADGVRLAIETAAIGVEVAVALRGDVASATIADMLSNGITLAWDADPTVGSVGRTVERVLNDAGDRLRHVRILGGGPETPMHEGRGIGELMGRLALAHYAGPVVLAPSDTRYRVAWETWLGRRGGSGCGSKGSDPSLVALSGGWSAP